MFWTVFLWLAAYVYPERIVATIGTSQAAIAPLLGFCFLGIRQGLISGSIETHEIKAARYLSKLIFSFMLSLTILLIVILAIQDDGRDSGLYIFSIYTLARLPEILHEFNWGLLQRKGHYTLMIKLQILRIIFLAIISLYILKSGSVGEVLWFSFFSLSALAVFEFILIKLKFEIFQEIESTSSGHARYRAVIKKQASFISMALTGQIGTACPKIAMSYFLSVGDYAFLIVIWNSMQSIENLFVTFLQLNIKRIKNFGVKAFSPERRWVLHAASVALDSCALVSVFFIAYVLIIHQNYPEPSSVTVIFIFLVILIHLARLPIAVFRVFFISIRRNTVNARLEILQLFLVTGLTGISVILNFDGLIYVSLILMVGIASLRMYIRVGSATKNL